MLDDLFPEADEVWISFVKNAAPPYRCQVHFPSAREWVVGTGSTLPEATAAARKAIGGRDAA